MRAILAEAASIVSHTGWLSQVPDDFREALLKRCVYCEKQNGQTITHGGDEAAGMFGVVSGSVGVYAAIGSSEAPLIHIGGPAFWFGFYPIANGSPRIISVTARTRCAVAHIPGGALQLLLDQEPERWRWLNLLSLESAALAVQALSDLLIRDNERRCAAVLLRVAGCRGAGNAPADANLTQDDLAQLSNLSRPTVSLILGRLADQGFVSSGYRTIRIKAPAQLRRLVG